MAAYQNAKMAEQLAKAMAGRNDIATNNADPVSQMQGQGGMPQQVAASQEPAGGRYANYTAPPANEGIDFARIGRGLSGLGAGIQGRGAEFSKGLREEKEQKQKLRQEALITDTMYSKRALDSGDMPGFLSRMQSRIDAGTKMGMDMTDSVRLYNLAETDPEAAKAQVNEVYMNLIDRKLVDAPAAVKTIKIFNEATGKNEIRVMKSNGQIGPLVGQAPVTKPTTQVNVGAGETSELKEMGKRLAENFYETQNKGEVARDMLFSLDKLSGMDDLPTDALAPLRLSVGQLANAVNIPDETIKEYLNTNPSQGQAFIAETASMVLKIMATQKGPQTNEDRIQIQKTIADLGNTPQANRFINNSARAIARRDVDRAEFEQEHYDKTGSAKGATKAWRKSLGGAPMISKYQKSSTGLPLFYHDFVDAVKNEPQNIDVSNKDILAAWKEQEEKAKKDMTKPGGK